MLYVIYHLHIGMIWCILFLVLFLYFPSPVANQSLQHYIEKELGWWKAVSQSWFSWDCFEFFPLRMMLAMGFVVYSLYYVDIFPFSPVLSMTFIMKACCVLSRDFSTSIEMIIYFCLKVHLYDITLNDLCLFINHSCSVRVTIKTNHHDQKQFEEEKLYFNSGHTSSLREVRTAAEGMEECFLLACFSWPGQPAFL